MSRPSLTSSISSAELRNFYYLKSELTSFAKELGLSTIGGKEEIIDRISSKLEGQATTPVSPKGKAPTRLTLDDLIPLNGQCGTASRAVFQKKFGIGFKFDGHLRDYMKRNAGSKKMKDAVKFFEETRDLPRKEITSQFELNRFMRDWKSVNAAKYPGKTAKQAWEIYKNTPADKRP
jgi:hypothetical protein